MRGWVGKAKNRRSQSAGAVAEPGAAPSPTPIVDGEKQREQAEQRGRHCAAFRVCCAAPLASLVHALCVPRWPSVRRVV